jgi:signal transduction histidine kinase
LWEFKLDQRWIWLFLTVVGYGALALLALRRRWQRFTAELLLLYVALSLIWSWSKPLASGAASAGGADAGSAAAGGPWQSFLRIVLAYGLVILSTIVGMLASMFVHRPASGPHDSGRAWFWAFDGSVILLIMIALDVTGVRWPAWSRLSTMGLSSSVAVIGWVLLSAVAFLVSWNAYSRTWRPLHRNRVLYILLDYPYCALGTLMHLTGTAGAIAALLGHRLPDLSGVVRQGLRQVMLTVLTALIFVGGIVLAQYIANLLDTGGRVGGLLGFLVGAVGVAVLLALSYPLLRRWMYKMLDRLLFEEGYDPQRILQEYSHGISNILDLDVLAPIAVGIIGEAMGVHHGTLLVCEPSSAGPTYSVGPTHSPDRRSTGRETGIKLRPIRGIGTLSVKPIEVDVNSPLVAGMAHSRDPISQYDLDLLPHFQESPEEERAWFNGLGAEVFVPIHAQDRLLGILALGAKVSGDPFTSGDVALLRTLAGQTAVALENARLVEDLRRLNAEITALNQALTITNERLAILDKTKSDFISISSHELKTPLTQVKGYADILLEISQDEADVQEAVRQMAEGICRGVRRLQTVVEAMLDVSLIEAQAFAIHPSLVSLRYVVEQVVDSLGPAFEERHQTVTVSGLEGLPNIMADSTRLYQALHNVVANGIKFTPDGGQIGVKVRLVQTAAESQAVEIAIADTGIGINQEHHGLIFEKFYRVGELNLHSTGQIKFKGAGPGLGLPIAKGIIEAHGGRIRVESEGCDEERMPGSTFYIVLPVDGPYDSSPAAVGHGAVREVTI